MWLRHSLVDQHILGVKVRGQGTPEWQKAEVVSWSWWSIRKLPIITYNFQTIQYIYSSTISHITFLFKHQFHAITVWKLGVKLKITELLSLVIKCGGFVYFLVVSLDTPQKDLKYLFFFKREILKQSKI